MFSGPSLQKSCILWDYRFCIPVVVFLLFKITLAPWWVDVCWQSSANRSQEIMDSTSPNFFGLGCQLTKVLSALDIQHSPIWTLKETKNKIFLDITWTKPAVKFPAESEVNKGTSVKQPSSHVDSVSGRCRGGQDFKPTKPGPTVVGRLDTGKECKKKRKSPATRKRDKQRFERWKENRKLKTQNADQCEQLSRSKPHVTEQTISQTIEKPIRNQNNSKGNQSHESALDSESRKVNAPDFPTFVCSSSHSCSCPRCRPTGKSELETPRPESNAATNLPLDVPDSPSSKCFCPECVAKSVESEVSTTVSTSFLEESDLEKATGIVHSEANQILIPLQIIENEAIDTYEYDSEPDTEEIMENPIKVCCNITCRIPETEVPGGLKRCTRCNFVLYCSRECQRAHWKIHRTTCGKIILTNLFSCLLHFCGTFCCTYFWT